MERIEMMITKKSMFSGTAHTMELPVTQAQLDRWQGGELIQTVFPFLSVSEREFLMTGVTAAEWDHEFGASGSLYAGDEGQHSADDGPRYEDHEPNPYDGTYSEE
jgi:hypothetical protein